MRRLLLALPFLALLGLGAALGSEDDREDPFRQLEELLPTPNVYRTASGAPGHAYWQQRADYVIEVELDDVERTITGTETISYHNASPDTLAYLWLQIDPNLFAPESHEVLTALSPDPERQSLRSVERMLHRETFDGAARISSVHDAAGEPLPHTINGTMMRVDLPEPLASGASVTFGVDWSYRINDHDLVGGRTGYELFDDGNAIYEIAQWFPRMAAYTDATGWQNKQFLGAGEFTLEFGDYHVHVTVPDDHVVAATGVLRNPEEVLTETQRERLRQARDGRQVFVVTPEEARENERTPPTGTKTWVFEAEDVRDFAWASSRKFAWDARVHPVEGAGPVLAMSFYPNEGEPLWSRYSTEAIVHTLDVYSEVAFPYPYPVAISVNGPVGGMEYPMICFNGPRPEADGTYSESTKYGLISVIIHEVGHNWFPMVVNSDERQWTWMDEGVNSFVQYLAEQRWQEDYPSWFGEPQGMVSYMTSERQVPIMTNSESILQFGSNAYGKPATALNVLRETVMGRELFDFAFRQYAERWRFKRPMPADLFRTLEDASAVDLDWFWRGWFYTTDHADVAVDAVRAYRIDTRNPDVEKPLARAEREAAPRTIAQLRNASIQKRVEAVPALLDFYDSYDELDVTAADRRAFEEMVAGLDEEDLALLDLDRTFYAIELSNLGGLVTPVPLRLEYADGSSELLRIPAEVWRKDATRVSKMVLRAKELVAVQLDPHLETADADTANNRFPRELERGTIQLRERRDRSAPNPMQRARQEAERAQRDSTD